MTTKSQRAFLIAAALLVFSCGDDSTPTPPGTTLQDVVVSVSTTGDNLDEDGYTVALGNRSLDVPISGSISFESVAPGSYEVRLTGLAENCAVEGDASPTVEVTETRGPR